MPVWNGSTGGGITEAQAEAAATAAITAAGLATAANLAVAQASITALTQPLTQIDFDHVGVDAEQWIVEPIPGSRIAVWGWIAVSADDTNPVEWCIASGTVLVDPPAQNDALTPRGVLGPGASQSMSPGVRYLYLGPASEGVISQKDTGITVRGTLWYTVIPNP